MDSEPPLSINETMKFLLRDSLEELLSLSLDLKGIVDLDSLLDCFLFDSSYSCSLRVPSNLRHNIGLRRSMNNQSLQLSRVT